MTKERLLEKLEVEVDRWNRDNPIGTVVVYSNPGHVVHGYKAHTTSAAFIADGDSRVFIQLHSISGAKPAPAPLSTCLPADGGTTDAAAKH